MNETTMHGAAQDFASAVMIADLRDELGKQAVEEADLRNRLAVAQRRLEEARELHRGDIETIGERLISEANDRSWCGQYDEIVDELNRDLSVELPTREKEYTVSVDIRVEVRVSATGELEAHNMALSAAGGIEHVIDSGEWDGANGATAYVSTDTDVQED